MKKTALTICLCAMAVAPAGPAPAAQALTAAECVQAQESAQNFYEQARKNTKLYATEEAARAGAQAYFARRIMAELGNSKTGTIKDYDEAVEHCRRRKAPHIAKLVGLLGATALKGVRGPATQK